MSSSTLNLTPALRDYLVAIGVRESPQLARLREETAALPASGMQISPEQGALMAMLVRLTGARRILEVGTFTGYSSLAMAEAMPEDGRVTCCDHSAEWTAVARRYWTEAGLADRFDLRLGDALDSLDALVAEGASFDLAFVDADKERYLTYHERCLALLRAGGVLLYDNVLWGGAVIDADNQSPSTLGVRALNEALAADERVDVVVVPIGDGLTIARKR